MVWHKACFHIFATFWEMEGYISCNILTQLVNFYNASWLYIAWYFGSFSFMVWHRAGFHILETFWEMAGCMSCSMLMPLVEIYNVNWLYIPWHFGSFFFMVWHKACYHISVMPWSICQNAHLEMLGYFCTCNLGIYCIIKPSIRIVDNTANLPLTNGYKILSFLHQFPDVIRVCPMQLFTNLSILSQFRNQRLFSMVPAFQALFVASQVLILLVASEPPPRHWLFLLVMTRLCCVVQ